MGNPTVGELKKNKNEKKEMYTTLVHKFQGIPCRNKATKKNEKLNSYQKGKRENYRNAEFIAGELRLVKAAAANITIKLAISAAGNRRITAVNRRNSGGITGISRQTFEKRVCHCFIFLRKIEQIIHRKMNAIVIIVGVEIPIIHRREFSIISGKILHD